ncbi:MAG: hypothetical protein JW959_05930 [Pirellulales bacterium]|nr:hypothetical protein [Pirellulales bacterium]
MKIPAHWAKATARDTDRKGKEYEASCWRSSDVSREDARESALAAAKRALTRIIGGERLDRYGYGATPLREEVIERHNGADGRLTAAVTRNSYGALVLNTSRAMFIDLDFVTPTVGEKLKHSFVRLFNKSVPSPEQRAAQEATRRLEAFIGEHRDWGLRLYRTRAGLRCLATHDLFDPSAEATLELLRSVGADPLYVRLCKAQECFRARLTPKPWRCRAPRLAVKWPRDEDEQRKFDSWLAGYESRCSAYATCRLLGTLGVAAVHPEIEKIIGVHDSITKCNEELDLA